MGHVRVFFLQASCLSSKGYRVICTEFPIVWSHREFANCLDRFLHHLNIRSAHFYGTSLGGFLAQVYCYYYPKKVASIALTNSVILWILFI